MLASVLILSAVALLVATPFALYFFQRNKRTAAMRLEELWNDLQTRQSFTLLCAYAVGGFYKEPAAEATDPALCGSAVATARSTAPSAKQARAARQGQASESIQRSSRRPSRVISSGSRKVLVRSAIPW